MNKYLKTRGHIMLRVKMNKVELCKFVECEVCSIYGQGLYWKQYFNRHLKSNEHKFNSEFHELNDKWKKEKNQAKRDKLFKDMEALYIKYPQRTRKSKNVNIMLEMDEEERNGYLCKTNNKYNKINLEEMD